MKKKKIRGHNRRWKAIEKWISANKPLDLDYLREYQNDYAKIRVHPWGGISVTSSQIPEPQHLTRQKLLLGLIEIYDSWQQALKTFDQPYYLKLWLFEPQFSMSQVVCALGKEIDYYETYMTIN